MRLLIILLMTCLIGCSEGTPVSKTSRQGMPSADWQLMGINEWEDSGYYLRSYTLRFKVKGGYLFRISTNGPGGRPAEAMTFVPDTDAK